MPAASFAEWGPARSARILIWQGRHQIPMLEAKCSLLCELNEGEIAGFLARNVPSLNRQRRLKFMEDSANK